MARKLWVDNVTVITSHDMNRIEVGLEDIDLHLKSNLHVTEQEKYNWDNKSNFSGKYEDLINKPFIPEKASQLDNDLGFITIDHAHDYMYYTKEEVDELILGFDGSGGGSIDLARYLTKTEAQTTYIGKTEEDSSQYITYTNTTPTSSSLGGISAGTSFNNTPIKSILDNLLYPYMPPTVSLSASPSSTIKEFGDSISSVQLTANVTRKSRDITYIKFYQEYTEINTVTDRPSGGTISYTHNSVVDSTTSFNVKVSDGNTIVTSNNISYTFVNPMYIGKLVSANPTESDIKTMTKMVKNKASSEAINYTTVNERFCFAYPSSYGTLSSVLDANSFEMLSDFNITLVNITNLAGSSIQYRVYTFKNIVTVDNFRVTFKF